MYQDSFNFDNRLKDLRETKEALYAETRETMDQLDKKLNQFKFVTVEQIKQLKSDLKPLTHQKDTSQRMSDLFVAN